ncbi:MAG: hypothetical protein M3N13_02895 [Candidatus Eremiobacteraeota bacterium]|nr:hypothetical protein [Candidatus Eremiobacteraeota bacterium]
MPETQNDLTRPTPTPGPPSTEASRQRHRDVMRRYRVRAADERAIAADGFSLDAICEVLHLLRSPQSCLNPAFWNDHVIYAGLSPGAI